MKLYKTPAAPPGERWHSSKTGLKDPSEVEMPKSGRAGMAEFLNANEREVSAPTAGRVEGPVSTHGQPLDELEQAELRAVAAASAVTRSIDDRQRDWDAMDIEDFILNRANTAQVESIFSRLGTRFKELVHGT